MKKGIVAIGIGVLGSFCLPHSSVRADTNSWTYADANPTHYAWNFGSSWSLGTLPSLNDNFDFITNASSKTITINQTTTTSFPGSLALTNLILSAPAGTTNTLFLNNAATNVPLHVFNELTVGSGGILQITNSFLQVDVTNGTFHLDGTLRTYGDAKVQARAMTIGSSAVLEFALGTNSSPIVVNNDLTIDGTLNVTNGAGFTGTTYTLFTYGTSLTDNGLTLGSMPPGYNGVLTNTATQVQLVVSFQSITAGFSASPTNGLVPLPVNFTDTSSGLITNRFWDFGDGSTTNILTNIVAHTYVSPGNYTVVLTACGPAGCSTVSNVNYIAVSGTGPVAAFTASPTNGAAPLLVTFTDGSTGAITNRFWDFGDSSTTNITTNSVSHSYSAGTYSVALTVTGPGGVSSLTRTNLITVGAPADSFQQWQLQYFSCTICPQAAGDADPDGDGISNTNEFLAGTVPTNDASAFRIISIVQSGPDLVITWKTAGVRTNALQATTTNSYSTNGFQDITTVILGTSGDTTASYTDVGGATNTPSRFYRVRLVTSGAASPTDTDGDGIPDAWMQQYFGHPTGQAGDHSLFSDDADGDGQSNLSEYLSGTDPTNSSSALQIISALRTGDDVAVTWSTAGGHTNILQVTSGITGSFTNNFVDLPASQTIVAGSGDTTANYTELGGATNAPSRFYRIRLVP